MAVVYLVTTIVVTIMPKDEFVNDDVSSGTRWQVWRGGWSQIENLVAAF